MPSPNKFSEKHWKQSAAIHLRMNHQVIHGNSPIHQTPPFTIPEPQPGAPGGPTNNAPLGILAPSSEYLARTSCSVGIEVTPMEFLTRQKPHKGSHYYNLQHKICLDLGSDPKWAKSIENKKKIEQERNIQIDRGSPGCILQEIHHFHKFGLSTIAACHITKFHLRSWMFFHQTTVPWGFWVKWCFRNTFKPNGVCKLWLLYRCNYTEVTKYNMQNYANLGYIEKPLFPTKTGEPSLINVPNNLPINPSSNLPIL